MVTINICGITWDDLDEILYGSDEEPVTDEIPEEDFELIKEVADVERNNA